MLNCGREQMCEPCNQLPVGERLTVCISVEDVLGSLVVSESSLAVLRDEMYKRLAFWVDDDDYVTHQMTNAGVASLRQLDAQASKLRKLTTDK